MQKTSNYQLCQWEAEDRILREDFNSDNVKLDAALKAQSDALTAETAARKSAVSSLSGRAGTQTIKTFTVSSPAAKVTVDLGGINWDAWAAVHISVEPVTQTDRPVSVHMGLAGETFCSVGGNTSASAAERYNLAHILLWPLFDRRRKVSGLALDNVTNGGVRAFSLSYERFTTLVLECGSDNQLLPGTKVLIWGEK